MAYDHNLRQKKNAQKAAEDVFEPKSHRDERILLSHASKSTWLATIGILVAMAVVYWVVTHFGTKGLKSNQQTQPMVELVSEADLDAEVNSELESLDGINDAQAETEGVSVESSENSQSETTSELVEASTVVGEASESQDALSWSFNGSDDVESQPAGHRSSGVIQRDSLPLPAEATSQAKMTFYEEMQQVEVPLDDSKKYPIQLEVPEYIVAGSFYREADARRELKRLSSYGQKLLLSESSGKGNRIVYVLKTQAYDNRRELGARKNELRDLGARVRSYPVK
ncbi:SPOR domain-containing protein [Thiomicrorhabdus indica]|uniref:SPOR domain-containing protein n=1 Tax=Thiomicrorhabdus indica TaxID=2267253 RepID=UPI002AA82FF0|nr:SPOR domain-containing protein [Thiomicrorhabdus indica]